MKDKLFEERQYLGANKYSLLSRIVLALFCFFAYYWSENPKPVAVLGIPTAAYPVQELGNSGQLFFLMGMIILVLSALLVFVLHIHIVVTPTSVVIDGLWTARKVTIDLSTIVEAKQITYTKYLLNTPVYNLHYKGNINFYTTGKDAIELTNNEGLKYCIGTQKADLLLSAIQTQMGQLTNKL